MGATMQALARRVVMLAAAAVLACLGGAISLVAPAASAATTASALPSATQCSGPGDFGAQYLGSAWPGGFTGVPVYSNGSATYVSNCYNFVTTPSGKSVESGMEWQCVELVNRLYLTKGWISSTWYGDGDQLYSTASSVGLTNEQRQGSITYLAPGDVISFTGPISGGHAAVVSQVNGSQITLVNQNTSQSSTFSTGTLSNGSLIMNGWAGYSPIGVIHAPTSPPPPPPPALASRNLLSNGSWGSGQWGPWQTIPVNGGKMNWIAYDNPAIAQQGAWYGASNTAAAGGSIYQDVPVTTSPGQSYTFSIWIRSASKSRVSGAVVLWGIGGTEEHAQTTFTVGPAWQLISVPLDITQPGHTVLRAQVYEGTTGTTYYFDGGQLVNDGLANNSWGSGQWGPWQTIPVNGGKMNWIAYDNPAIAQQGAWYGASNTAAAGGSIYQDVPVTTSPGQSYTFSIWIRSASKSRVSGAVVLWGIGGTEEHAQTTFTVGPAWQLISVPLDITQPGHTVLRAQVYEGTTGTTYYFDGGTLAPGELARPQYLALHSMTPSKIRRGTKNVRVTITGTNFYTGVMLTDSNRAIKFTSIVVVSATTIRARVTIPRTARLGLTAVTVREPGALPAVCSCLRVVR